MKKPPRRVLCMVIYGWRQSAQCPSKEYIPTLSPNVVKRMINKRREQRPQKTTHKETRASVS